MGAADKWLLPLVSISFISLMLFLSALLRLLRALRAPPAALLRAPPRLRPRSGTSTSSAAPPREPPWAPPASRPPSAPPPPCSGWTPSGSGLSCSTPQTTPSSPRTNFPLHACRSFSQEIAPLPAFSVLDLSLLTQKLVFGALVSHMHGICSTIRSLQVDIKENMGKGTCSPNCPCDQPQNWRNEIISMTALEEIKITGFG